MIIIMLGAQGSGKGTVGTKLAEALEIPHISTGDIFRENIKNNTELGIEANKYILEGKLVPDELTNRIVADRLAKEDTKNGALLDGYPRTKEQCEELDRILGDLGRQVDLAINLDVPYEELIERITTRRVCKGCKEGYNTVFSPTKVEGVCDKCGGAGAGKSTVMDCLNGRDCEGMEGTVEVNGTDLISNIERLKYLIGVVPQFDDLRDILTVEQEIAHAAKHGLPNDTKKSEIEERVTATLKMLGIENVRKNKIGKCSGGERKRVNIGIELVADKQFLCMDEPDAGLDPGNKRRLFELLQKLAHKEGRTIITIIHDVSDIELFDKVIILNKVDNVGRLAFVGKPDEVKDYFCAEIKDVYAVMAENPKKYIYRS